VKRTGKRTWRPERVVSVAEGGGAVSEGVVVAVVVVAGLKAVCPLSSPILVINVRNMWEVSMEGSHI
jgi:hypothetical protein